MIIYSATPAAAGFGTRTNNSKIDIDASMLQILCMQRVKQQIQLDVYPLTR